MPLPSAETLQAVQRASRRAAAVVHEDMKQGLSSLATIASIAPFVGVFGTVFGILTSFIGCGGEKSACMAAVAERLSVSIWPTALGLLAGLISLWSYRFFAGRLQTFDRDMENGSLALVNQLTIYGDRLKPASAMPVSDRPMFGEKSLAELQHDQRSWRRSMFLASAAFVVAWCLQVVRYSERYSLPLDSATWLACVHLLFTFGVSCFPAYAMWVKLLHRRPGGLAALTSALCLCWGVVGLVSSVHLP
jgi:hypothetical protein